jgi:hypothetical protein
MKERRLPFVIMSFKEDPRLTDAFELAIKPAIQSVLDLSEEDIRRIRIDEATALERYPASSLPCISEKILESIRNSLFVVCDTTGNRPNCYFELGYALAHRKHIFLLHRENAGDPHFNIKGRPIIFYTGASELREKLEEAISNHFGKHVAPSVFEIEDFFDRCGLPLLPLEGDAKYDYRISEMGEIPIRLDLVTDKKYSAPKRWRKIFNEVLAKQLEAAGAEGNVLFNGDLVRLREFRPLRDERINARFIRLDVEPTDYYTFISSNHAWPQLDMSHAEELRKMECGIMHNLKSSILANALTVSVSVIVKHEGKEWVLIQERNIEKVFHCKQRFQCSAAGMVSAHRDQRSHGIDVFATAKNELEEELGVAFREDQIRFLGLLRETRNYEVGLVAEIFVSMDPNKLLKPRADSFEVIRVRACEFTPEAYARFIRTNGGISNFVPLGVGAIVYSLLKRFPAERIEASMSSVVMS